MTIQNDSIIYILCPGNMHSGGPELLHQFASRLIANGYDARMYYTDPKEENPVDPFYAAWHIPFVSNLEDDPNNVIVFPETVLSAFFLPQQAQRVIWWLSVDHYLISYVKIMEHHISHATEYELPPWYLFQENVPVMHLVQSEYARRFLRANNVAAQSVRYLGDYLNPVFLQKSRTIDASLKRDYIAYNPKKGLDFTKKLIAAAPDLKWLPIQNMTPAQVETLLAGAKVYIDFGYHPGKDRIPREAAVSGCCVITSVRGAAANDIDVPIPAKYKFPDTEEHIPSILSLIREILADYPSHSADFDTYRAIIRNEPDRFKEDIAGLFPPVADRPVPVALLADASEAPAISARISFPQGYTLGYVVDDENAAREVAADGHALPVISYADALFLYREARIGCFAFSADSDEERHLMTDTLVSIGISPEQIMAV